MPIVTLSNEPIILIAFVAIIGLARIVYLEVTK